jgi:UDP-N-acetylmuramoyl-tripeptide--D-alanyl-D-alanine ligase
MPKLAELVKAVPQSRLLGDEKTMSLEFTSVSTDSRSLTPGALFFALSGPHFDGEEFIEAAQRRGAIAAVVTAKRLDELQMKALRQESRLPQIEVPDPLLALQQWAHYWRQNWLGRVIAVTGSNGKTTVKQMLAAIGGQALRGASVWATPGNLNNHIGLPLSVLGLQPQHRLAIFELGMNHPGEINILAAIACAQIELQFFLEIYSMK